MDQLKKDKKVKKSRKRELSTRERLALLLYIKNKEKNMTECCIKAGYPEASACIQGSQLLKHELSVQFLDQYREKALKKYAKSADDVLDEVACLAFSDIKNYFNEDANGTITLKTLSEMGKESRAIRKIKHRKRDVFNSDGNLVATINDYEYELHPKMNALDLLALHHSVVGKDRGGQEGQQLALPQIILPDNGKTGKVAIFVEMK